MLLCIAVCCCAQLVDNRDFTPLLLKGRMTPGIEADWLLLLLLLKLLLVRLFLPLLLPFSLLLTPLSLLLSVLLPPFIFAAVYKASASSADGTIMDMLLMLLTPLPMPVSPMEGAAM